MPDRLRYADVLRRWGKRLDFEVENFEPVTVTEQILREDAAALRRLAALCEEVRAWQNAPYSTSFDESCERTEQAADLLEQIAAGFDPQEGQ